MTEKKDTKRRLIKPQKTEVVQVVPGVDALMNDALSIISSELSKYKSKSVRGITLDLKEARVVQGYIESLAKLKKEEREAARQHDLSNLTDEELAQLAGEVLGKHVKPKVINTEDKKVEPPKDDE